MENTSRQFDGDQADPAGPGFLAPTLEPVPILPVNDAVVFPNMTVGFHLEDSDRIDALQATLPQSREVLVVPVTETDAVDEQRGQIVTRARVLRFNRVDNGVMVLVEGLARNRLDDVRGQAPQHTGLGSRVVETSAPGDDEYWRAAIKNLRQSAASLVNAQPNVPDQVGALLDQLDKPAALTDFLAANLNLETTTKRDLLNELNVVRRVDRLQAAIDEQLRIASLQEKLRATVQTELTDAQRRAYLREQMRAIQKELGDGDGSDETIATLRDKLSQAGLPEKPMEQVNRELERLARLPSASPDYASTLDYLETIAALPWSKRSDAPIDLDVAEEILNRDHYGLDKVKRRIIEYLAVRKLNPEGRGPILCLVGPPGVGKTSLGQSIASALGRDFVRVALGGVRDESEIRGHRRTYVGSMMGRVMQEIKRAGTRDPVMMLDEIDKMGTDLRGDPSSALLEVLDPAQNSTFVDHYLNLPFDLSQVVFVCTANLLDTIPAPLRDRLEIVKLSGYTPTEKREIGLRYLIKRQLTANGLTTEQVTWQPEAVEYIINDYTREAGVRLLEQKLASVIRFGAAKVARDQTEKFHIDKAFIAQALGPENFTRDQQSLEDRIGMVNGLAYTPVGGEVLPIEAVRYPGSGRLQLTGQLGDVMQESAKAAESLLKSRVEQFGITTDFAKTDSHLHVPAGAIPKDGPSAGAAMFVALVSLHGQYKVRGDVGMTGEINLRGDVLPIGGLTEKTLAALAAGLKTVLIPSGNKKDIPQLPAEVTAQLTLIPVSTVEEVAQHALIRPAG